MRYALWTWMVITLISLAGTALAKETHLIDFTLEDQFRTVHNSADLKGRIVLIIGSDSGGGDHARLWGEAIDAALIGHPNLHKLSKVGYADLRGIPKLLKGIVRKKFPKDPEEWAVMDWRGEIAKAYDFAPHAANIALFAPEGALVHQLAVTDFDQSTFDTFMTVLKELLEGAEN